MQCLTQNQDETIEMFKYYKLEVENQFSTHRMIHQTTDANYSQPNGIGESKNRTLKEMINVMLISLELRRSFAFPQLHSQQIVS